MKTKYRLGFIDLNIYLVLLLSLTGCGTEPPVKVNTEPRAVVSEGTIAQSSRSSGRVSSSSSSAAALNKTVSLSSASDHHKHHALAQQASAAALTTNVQATSRASSTSSASNQALVATTQANSSLAGQTAANNPAGGISGMVKVTGKNGEILSPEGVIINLEPTNTLNDVATSQEKRQHDVHMLNKTYSPKLMTIKQNDQITFSNKDNIKHNVFSTSAGNRFDLGTYGKGEKNKVALKAPGVVKVYCNIHPEMALFVSVTPNNYSHITNKNGSFEITNLPLGEYRLTAWHIRGESQQIVNVQSLRTKKDILINTESYVPVPHKNKHDEAYKVKAVLFEDEFY